MRPAFPSSDDDGGSVAHGLAAGGRSPAFPITDVRARRRWPVHLLTSPHWPVLVDRRRWSSGPHAPPRSASPSQTRCGGGALASQETGLPASQLSPYRAGLAGRAGTRLPRLRRSDQAPVPVGFPREVRSVTLGHLLRFRAVCDSNPRSSVRAHRAWAADSRPGRSPDTTTPAAHAGHHVPLLGRTAASRNPCRRRARFTTHHPAYAHQRSPSPAKRAGYPLGGGLGVRVRSRSSAKSTAAHEAPAEDPTRRESTQSPTHRRPRLPPDGRSWPDPWLRMPDSPP
jgi:hypothetical protein